jgi:uncharacterized protein YndB with AHSA1/START domain
MQTLTTMTVTTPSEREIVLKRFFAAPRELVFLAWTKPELVKRWNFGPDGWSLPTCEIELKPGGAIRYVWKHADGATMGMRGAFREIEAPAKLVHTETFDDDWTGGETTVTTRFAEQQPTGTIVTTTILFASREARDAARGFGMEKGVARGYERLEEVLEAERAPAGQRAAGAG